MKVKVEIVLNEFKQPIDHIGDLFYFIDDDLITTLEDIDDIRKAREFHRAIPITLNFGNNRDLIASTKPKWEFTPIVEIKNLKPLLFLINKLTDIRNNDIFVNLQIESKVLIELIPEKWDGILRDCDNNEIKDGCFVSIQGAEPIKVHKFDNEFYFVPYKDIVKVKEYFKDDIKIAYYE